MQSKKPSLEYIAGFVDGEGTITISKEKTHSSRRGFTYGVYFCVSNTNRELLQLMCNTVSVGYVARSNRNRNFPRRKEIFHWSAHRRKAAALIQKLLPHLYLKGAQAELALKYQEAIIQGHQPLTEEECVFRDQCYMKMKELNRRGRIE